MTISIMQLIFAVFPESLLLIYVGLGLVKIKTNCKVYLKLASIYTICFGIVRMVFNSYRLHSLILCLILSLIFKICLDLEYSLAMIASLLGIIVLILGEVLIGSFIIDYFGVNMTEYVSQGGLNFFKGFYLMKIPLLVVSGLIYYFNFSIR